MRRWLWPDQLAAKVLIVLGLWALFCTITTASQGEWSRTARFALFAVGYFGASAFLTRRRSRQVSEVR